MSNVTFKQEDAGFIAQVAYAEVERRYGPYRHALRRIGYEFEQIAMGRVAAEHQWGVAETLLEEAVEFDVWDDILDLMFKAAKEAV